MWYWLKWVHLFAEYFVKLWLSLTVRLVNCRIISRKSLWIISCLLLCWMTKLLKCVYTISWCCTDKCWLVGSHDIGWFSWYWLVPMILVGSHDIGWFSWHWLVLMILVGSHDIGWYSWYWLVLVTLVGSHDIGWFSWHWLVLMILVFCNSKTSFKIASKCTI